LYYYRARYYDPKAGRFVTRDPIGFDGGDVNLYTYVRNNPINYIDSQGKVSCMYTITGRTLTCTTEDNETISCYTISGDNDPNHQCRKFKGPIPIGWWGIGIPDNRDYAPLYESWPNSNYLCKEDRRDSLYIHVLGRKGSEGCIAITSSSCKDEIMKALRCEEGGILEVVQ
jgi:uncharacterized protein RhaS with RHS repeats